MCSRRTTPVWSGEYGDCHLPRDCDLMAQCSLGSLLQTKSCFTRIFWAERLLVCNQVQIISDAQITSLYHLHGCHMGSCPHLGTPGPAGCWFACRWAAWRAGLAQAAASCCCSLNCTELFLGRALLLHRFSFSQLTSVDFALGSESLQPMGLIPSSELTMNRLVLTVFQHFGRTGEGAGADKQS